MKIFTLSLFIMASSMASAQVNWQNNPVGAVFAREGGEAPAGCFRLTSGGYEVFTLITSDKTEFYQPASLFYGENDANKQAVDELAPSGKVASSMNCFLVKTDGKAILFDTGLPESRGGKTLQRLSELKVAPTDIAAIFITHSHYDHIGGLIENSKANFPNATIYVSEKELEYMETSMGEMTEQIKKAYAGRIVSFNSGELLPFDIMPIDAAGHTPGHVVYRIGNLLFAGDILHGMAVQLIDPNICANFDADKTQAIKSREEILRYAAANSLTVLGAHVPNNGVLF